MPSQINGKTFGSVFYGSTPIAEVYRGSTLVWQNVPKVTIEKISDVWTLLRSPEHIVRSNGKYWNASDQFVSGVPNWNDWAIPEVPFRIVLAPTFTAGMGMFSSYLGGYPATNKLVTAPEMDTRNLTDMTAFFWNAVNLENIPEYTITACTSLKDFVGNCPKVKSVALRDCGKVQDLRNAFGAGSETMPACTRVELHGLGPSLPSGHVLDLSRTALTAEGATALFASLGTITAGRTVTLKLPDSALGASQRVARSKGWTVTPFVEEDTPAAFTVVTADTTVIVPAWAGYVDAVAIGGGGGGHGGFAVISQPGRGGAAGQWANTSGIVSPGASLTVSIGVGGAAQTDGGSTTITAAGTALVSAGGGANSGMSGYVGGTPSPYTAFGFTFTGGSGGRKDTAGGAPGGGGGGGGGDLVSSRPGHPGGRGQVWLRFRSY